CPRRAAHDVHVQAQAPPRGASASGRHAGGRRAPGTSRRGGHGREVGGHGAGRFGRGRGAVRTGRVRRVLFAVLLAVLALPTRDAQARPADAPEPTRLAVDVLVYGSEPEAIVAAVAAAEEGAETLLVTPDERLGGLFVLGELNVLDLKTQPHDYQSGLFERWWRLVGRGESFDVHDAEAAFTELLAAAGVRVVRSVAGVRPLVVEPGVLAGIEFEAG